MGSISLKRCSRSAAGLLGLALLTLGLMGCGWHLRGSADLPEGTEVAIETSDTQLERGLATLMEASGVPLTSDPAKATNTLRVGEERFDRRVLSVDERTGKVREYELAYSLRFSVTDAQGAEVISPQTLVLNRNFLFNENEVLGSAREQEVLVQEMRREAVRNILFRIQAASR